MYKAFQTHFTTEKSGAQLIDSQPYKCKDSDISTLLCLHQSEHKHRAGNKLSIPTMFTNLHLNRNVWVDPIRRPTPCHHHFTGFSGNPTIKSTKMQTHTVCIYAYINILLLSCQIRGNVTNSVCHFLCSIVWIQNAFLQSSDFKMSLPPGEDDIFSVPRNFNNAEELWLTCA